MLSDRSDEVLASYHRCRADEGFVDTFYDLFLAQSTEVAAKFAHTDFPHQKLMLRQALLEMLSFDRGLEGSEAEIAKLADQHKELGVTSEMYSMWLEALCVAVARHDPEYTPELGELWRQAMQRGIERMQV